MHISEHIVPSLATMPFLCQACSGANSTADYYKYFYSFNSILLHIHLCILVMTGKFVL